MAARSANRCNRLLCRAVHFVSLEVFHASFVQSSAMAFHMKA
jgi:hypothetical protein